MSSTIYCVTSSNQSKIICKTAFACAVPIVKHAYASQLSASTLRTWKSSGFSDVSSKARVPNVWHRVKIWSSMAKPSVIIPYGGALRSAPMNTQQPIVSATNRTTVHVHATKIVWRFNVVWAITRPNPSRRLIHAAASSMQLDPTCSIKFPSVSRITYWTNGSFRWSYGMERGKGTKKPPSFGNSIEDSSQWRAFRT